MYLTLKPELNEFNTYSKFVCELIEPIVLSGSYHVALTEFYYPMDYSVEIGCVQFAVPENYTDDFTLEKSERFEKDLNNLFDSFKQKSDELRASSVGKFLQVCAELDYTKNLVILYLIQNSFLFSNRTRNVIEKFVNLEKATVSDWDNDALEMHLKITSQLNQCLQNYMRTKLIFKTVFHNDRSDEKINLINFIRDNVILDFFDYKTFHSSVFKVEENTLAIKSNKFVQNLIIYTDIIAENQTLNKNQPILKIIKPEVKFGEYVEKIYDRPNYMPCDKTFINKIKIEIKDNNFNFVNFNSEGIILKLHFKKVK